jgi:hypothetical protein
MVVRRDAGDGADRRAALGAIQVHRTDARYRPIGVDHDDIAVRQHRHQGAEAEASRRPDDVDLAGVCGTGQARENERGPQQRRHASSAEMTFHGGRAVRACYS